MTWIQRARLILTLALSALILVACAAGSQTGQGAPPYTDPFEYCAAVKNIDQPDKRYSGPAMPDSIVRGLQQAFGAPADAPLEPFQRNSYWRCMDGKVYACNVGANIPCTAKASTSRKPTPPMTEYCKTNPTAGVIPAYVAGRETVYLWGCTAEGPVVLRQVNKPDARGFLASFWHRIEPK